MRKQRQLHTIFGTCSFHLRHLSSSCVLKLVVRNHDRDTINYYSMPKLEMGWYSLLSMGGRTEQRAPWYPSKTGHEGSRQKHIKWTRHATPFRFGGKLTLRIDELIHAATRRKTKLAWQLVPKPRRNKLHFRLSPNQTFPTHGTGSINDFRGLVPIRLLVAEASRQDGDVRTRAA
jgi:hypothetical protein